MKHFIKKSNSSQQIDQHENNKNIYPVWQSPTTAPRKTSYEKKTAIKASGKIFCTQNILSRTRYDVANCALSKILNDI